MALLLTRLEEGLPKKRKQVTAWQEDCKLCSWSMEFVVEVAGDEAEKQPESDHEGLQTPS